MSGKTDEEIREMQERLRALSEAVDAAKSDRWALRALLEAVPQRVFWKDRNSIYLGGNSKIAVDCGYTDASELPGTRDHDHFPQEEADFYVKCDREVMAAGTPLLNIEEPQTRPNGKTSWLLTSKVPLRDDDGEIVGMLGTYMDITEQKETEDQLQQALVRAKVSEAKSDFLTTVSHELRTPLTLVISPLASLLTRNELPEDVRQELAVARRNALRLKQIVDDVLDLRKSEAGMVKSHQSAVDVGEHLGSLLRDMVGAAERADVSLSSTIDPAVGVVDTDSALLERATINLVGNALKFTPAGGRIVVDLRRDHETVVLSIADTGVGIDPTQLERLFQPYEQVGSHRGGTGLGLAIVKQIAETLGGSVSAKSEIGKGSTFQLRFPGEKSLNAPSPREPVSSLEDTVLTQLPVVSEHPTTNAADPKGSDLGFRILLAEDNPDMRNHVQRILSDMGTIHVCTNGREALSAVEGFGPDVIVSDVMMPEVDGISLVQKLKASARWRPVPVILLTARAGNEAIASGLDSGADDYVCKPFEPSELRARVRAAVRLHHTYRELDQRKAELANLHRELERATESLLDLEPLALLGQQVRTHAETLQKAVDSLDEGDPLRQRMREILERSAP